jgi:hypothetical protein
MVSQCLQERSSGRKKSDFAIESVRITLPTNINNRNDDALIKNSEAKAENMSPVTQSQINRVTVKIGDGNKRERSVEDIIAHQFNQEFKELLRKAFVVESKKRSDSGRSENNAVDMDASITSQEDEATGELLNIEQAFARQHELLKKSIRIDDESPKEQTSCGSETDCKTKNLVQPRSGMEDVLKDDLSKSRFPEGLVLSKNENFSQTKYDSLMSLVEDAENEEGVDDFLEMENKYEELLMKVLESYERDKKEAPETTNKSERSLNDDGEN